MAEASPEIVEQDEARLLLREHARHVVYVRAAPWIDRAESLLLPLERDGARPRLFVLVDARPVSENGLDQHAEPDAGTVQRAAELAVALHETLGLPHRGKAFRMEREGVEDDIASGPIPVFDHLLREQVFAARRERRDVEDGEPVRREKRRLRTAGFPVLRRGGDIACRYTRQHQCNGSCHRSQHLLTERCYLSLFFRSTNKLHFAMAHIIAVMPLPAGKKVARKRFFYSDGQTYQLKHNFGSRTCMYHTVGLHARAKNLGTHADRTDYSVMSVNASPSNA